MKDNGKLKRTMRVEIGSVLYDAIMLTVKNKKPWALEAKMWNIVDAERIEQTNYITIYLEEF